MRLTHQLEASQEAPHQARVAFEPLRQSLSTERWEDLRLLVTELVTNAVKYGAAGGPITLTAERFDGHVRVDVVNVLAPGQAVVTGLAGAEGLVGLGLALVAAWSTAWGHELDPAGATRVWFELDAT